MAKEKKSEFLRGFGKMFEIVKMLVNAVLDIGGDDSDLERILKDADLRKEIAKLIVGAKKAVGLPVAYDQAIGLMNLIKRALGPDNDRNFNTDITPERFPLKGTDVRTVQARVEPFLPGETGEQAAKRLTVAGHTLANTGDLAGFLFDHPKEVEKWNWVVALSEDSRWSNPDGNVHVPFALVLGANRRFHLGYFRDKFRSVVGVLVLCE